MDFRVYLQNELLERCRRNHRYSIRAFAQTLQIQNSALSKILRGQRGVSPNMMIRLAKRLGMGPDQVTQLSCEEAGARPYSALAGDAFAVISDWFHFAIMELTRVKGFRNDARWISKVLGITPSEVNIAIERCLRMGLLRETEDRNLVVTGNHTTGDPTFGEGAFRRLQSQVLEKALHALEETPVKLRDQSSMTMAVDSTRLAKARDDISNFRRKLAAQLGGSERLDEVYHLSISLYPVSHIGKRGVGK